MMPSNKANTWERKKQNLISGELRAPLAGLLLVMLSLAGCIYFITTTQLHHNEIISLATLLLMYGIFLLYITHTRIKQNLIEPLSDLRDWANLIRNGNLSAQVPVPTHGEFVQLAHDINTLGESLRSLSHEMDETVKQQTHALGMLYDVALSSNKARSLDDLLKRYLNTLAEILNAKISTARLITKDDQLRIVGCINYKGKLSDAERKTPIEHCLCAQNFSDGVFYCKSKNHQCGNLLPYSNKDESLHVISLPLQYQNRTLGIYNFFVEKYDENHEANDLLDNIGQHLSLAIEKVRLDNESKRITIMQERNMLAHELHDSLAQTLASLRIRVTMLLNSLGHENIKLAIGEAIQLKNGVDEANSELRELVSHFRIHMDERGLIPATESLIEQFQNTAGISVYFQNECAEVKLSPHYEIQILHIIQESLTNVRKHSDANNVRVLIRCNEDEMHYHVLIEDDGKGIEAKTVQSQPGENVGLNIMKERAEQLNGTLSIETEPGEGTRIELDFNYTDNETNEESTV